MRCLAWMENRKSYGVAEWELSPLPLLGHHWTPQAM